MRELIHQRAGISLHAGKQAMVYSRLSRRLRETGHRSFGSYLQWLEHSGAAGAAEWQEFINCLTTNLTSFFREDHHFAISGRGAAQRAPAGRAHLVLRRVHRRGALLDRDDGRRGAGPRARA